MALVFYLKYAFHFFAMFSLCAIAFIPSVIFFRRAFIQEYFGYAYGRITSFLLGIKIEIRGRENRPNKPVVYVMNHQSSIDGIPVMYLKLPRTKLVGKKELLFVPIFGWTFYTAGNILIDRSSGKKSTSTLDYSVDAIHRRGVSILVFPEGTRTMDGEFHPFKQGAFRMAAQADVPIVPVVVSSYTTFIDKKKKRWRRGKIIIELLPAIEATSAEKSASKELSTSVYEKMKTVFEKNSAELK